MIQPVHVVGVLMLLVVSAMVLPILYIEHVENVARIKYCGEGYYLESLNEEEVVCYGITSTFTETEGYTYKKNYWRVKLQ